MEKEVQRVVEEIKDMCKVFDRSIALLDRINKKSSTMQKEAEILYRMVKFIEMPIEGPKKCVIFFEDFDVLSIFLESRKYTDLEIYKIISFLVTKNVAAGIDRTEEIIDCRKVIKFNFVGFTQNEIIDYMNDEKISYMVNNYDNLTAKEKSFFDQIMSNLSELKLGVLDETQKANMILNKYFTDMKDEYTLEDIEIVAQKLSELKVSKLIVESVRRVMEKRYKKRKNKEALSTPIKYTSFKMPEKKYLTDAEYKILLKKIKEVYDIYNVKLKKELTEEEMMEVVSAMVKIGYDESQVNRFVKLARESFEIAEIEIKKFIENYDRYLYYLGEEEIKVLLDYLEQMMITSDEEYSIWKEAFLEELDKINEKIKYKQGYEYQKVKKI